LDKNLLEEFAVKQTHVVLSADGSLVMKLKINISAKINLVDSVLDWEHDLPEPFFSDSWAQSEAADLSIVLGSSLQIQPANTLPTLSKKMAIINLSNTKMDRKANLIIKSKCDFAVEMLMKKLDIGLNRHFLHFSKCL
jgi:hypothetical protein